jgi:hypothetical protein
MQNRTIYLRRFGEHSSYARLVPHLFSGRSRGGSPLALGTVKIKGVLGVAIVGVQKDNSKVGYFLPYRWIEHQIIIRAGEKGPANYVLAEGRSPDRIFADIRDTMRITEPQYKPVRLPGISKLAVEMLHPTQAGIDPLRLAAWEMYRQTHRLPIDVTLYGKKGEPVTVGLYGSKKYFLGGHTKSVDSLIRGITYLSTSIIVIPDEALYGDSLQNASNDFKREWGSSRPIVLSWIAMEILNQLFAGKRKVKVHPPVEPPYKAKER